MATSIEYMGWREQLNNHPFSKLLKNNNVSVFLDKNVIDSKSLFCINGSDIYAWNSAEKCVLFCSLKTIRISEENSTKDREIDSSGEVNPEYQKLLVSDAFTLDVEGISINPSGNYIVLWNHHAIRVVELPGRWGKNALFEGGKKTVSCKTIKIGERNFSGHKNLHIRQVSWHPGSKTDSHLALLTSDNMFSVYNVLQPEEPTCITNINTGEQSPAYSPSKSFVAPALGETAVAFDLGKPLLMSPKQKKFSVPAIEVWPVYCVRGNGDILLLYSHLSHFLQVKFPVQGPLAMNPPAEDNYGVDACSIICLHTAFPVLIVSTCDGHVHHCVQLSSPNDDASFQSDLNLSSSLVSSPVEPSLYVVETAELDLCLNVPKLDGDLSIDDGFMCPVHLKKDPSSQDRYFCVHAAGVHCVALPWLNAVQTYFLEEDGESMPDENECIIEHLVCTKPLQSCPTSPVLGVDIVNDALLGTTLLVLTSDYDFTALPIGLQYCLGPASNDATVSKSLNQPSQTKDDFSQLVKQILQKKDYHPLLKSSSSTEQSQKNCFKLLIQATQVLRQEYIPRLDRARQAIDTRIDVLREYKKYHLEDLKRLMDARHDLKEHATLIAERLESTKENHEKLFKRLETLLRRLQNSSPVLSDSERQMMKELNRIKDNLQMYEQGIKQVKSKQDHQAKQILNTSRSSGLFLQEGQLNQIHSVLQEETNQITELRKELTQLSLNLS